MKYMIGNKKSEFQRIKNVFRRLNDKMIKEKDVQSSKKSLFEVDNEFYHEVYWVCLAKIRALQVLL